MEAIAAPAVAMPGAPSAAHDLKALVLSRYPAIVIETSEPDRAEALVTTVANDL
jgi:hypothetical protein